MVILSEIVDLGMTVQQLGTQGLVHEDLFLTLRSWFFDKIEQGLMEFSGEGFLRDISVEHPGITQPVFDKPWL